MGTPKHVVVIGAGVGGLGTALALSRDGHRVTLLERDATTTPADADAAFAWNRRGAPQVHHSHALLARLHNLLRDRFPEVLERLLAAGATEMRFCDNLPAEMTDREPRPGDDDLVAIACRRTTFEWVLRTSVLAEGHVSLRDGVAVEGLVTTPDPQTGRPLVTGVRIAHDDHHEIVDADLVVASTGRRSGAVRWLADAGVEADVTEEDTGIIYLSRFYRLRDGAAMPTSAGPIGGDLGYLKYAVFQGDNRTWSVTFAVRIGDDEMRVPLLDPDTFDLVARSLPATSAWVAAEMAHAITPVNVMAGLLNRRIRYLDPQGVPIALGFHAVGDAHTCTNPLYGRGCSLAMVQATLLADALGEHPQDAIARAVAYEAASACEIEPWYKASVSQDRLARRQAERDATEQSAEPSAAADGSIGGTPGDSPPPGPGAEADPADFMREVMREGLFPAVRTDATVFRAFLRAFNLLEAPDALLQDADVIGRVLAVYQDREHRPPEPVLGPPRGEMLRRLEPASN